MKLSGHHRPGHTSSTSGQKLHWFAVVIAVALLGSGAYLIYRYHSEEPPPPSSADVAPMSPGSAPKPADHSSAPARIPPAPPADKAAPPTELPVLEDSDSAIRNQLQQLTNDPEWLHWLQGENLIQRAVGFVDALARGTIARKLLPIAPPGEFVITTTGGKTWLDQANYQRFNHFTTLITSIDTQRTARLFHWLRELLEASYGELGYAAEDFDKALLAAIDQCLATPEVIGPIALAPKAKGYVFEDPALELRPTAQKQLLRMGPDNVRAIKGWLRGLRSALIEGPSPAEAVEPANSPVNE